MKYHVKQFLCLALAAAMAVSFPVPGMKTQAAANMVESKAVSPGDGTFQKTFPILWKTITALHLLTAHRPHRYMAVIRSLMLQNIGTIKINIMHPSTMQLPILRPRHSLCSWICVKTPQLLMKTKLTTVWQCP